MVADLIRLSKKDGDFQAGSANTDLPAVHRGKFAHWWFYSWVLRVDGLGPEPPITASMDRAAVVGNWFRRILFGTT